ncbi:MAG: nickel-dependent lactate racemase [bacterium]
MAEPPRSGATLKYGGAEIRSSHPLLHSAALLEPPPPPPLISDPVRLLLDALLRPVAAPPLKNFLRRKRSALIAVSDRYRDYHAPLWMPALLNAVSDAGIPPQNVAFIVANGTHPPPSDSDKAAILGADAAAGFPVFHNDCDDTGAFFHAGRTSRGTPVGLNRRLADFDALILTGQIQPHYYAGFGGGRKTILPGLCARESILRNHSLNLSPAGGSRPAAATCVLDGNPVHEDMVEACRMAGGAFLVNFVLNSGAVAGVFAGDPVTAHLEGCRFCASLAAVPLRRKADLVIASNGGSPFDLNLFQAHKGFDNAFRAVAPGGALVWLAACSEGAGMDGFSDWLAVGDTKEIERRLRLRFEVPGYTALRFLEKAAACRVFLVSALDPGFVTSIGFVPAASLDDALERALAENPRPSNPLVIPRASSTVPIAG